MAPTLLTPPARRRIPITDVLIHTFLLLLTAAFLLPFLLVLAVSFTDEKTVLQHGYALIPSKFSLAAYHFILADPTQILRAYAVSITVSLVGAALGLLVMALLAYPLSRLEFRYRRPLSFFVFFTLLFNGGLVASYILVTRYLRLTDTLGALILPSLVVPFYVLLLRSYFASLPSEVIEAARIDGAGEWRIFFSIVLPLSTPALATVGLFMLLGYWNDYFLGLLYLNNSNLYPLQLLLFNLLNNLNFLSSSQAQGALQVGVSLPTETVRMAMAVLATGPVALAFLLVQGYFVRGVTLGAVKG